MVSKLKSSPAQHAVFSIAAFSIAAALFMGSANATVLYDNGVANGHNNGWTVTSGLSVGSSFTLSDAAVLTGASFTLWNNPGDTTSAIDWAITADPSFGPAIFSGTGTVSQNFQTSNDFGYAVNLDNILFPNLALNAGTYWLVLRNAVNSNNNLSFWDINGGPSESWTSAYGFNPDPNTYAAGLGNTSTSFQIIGELAGPNGTDLPEPASFTLFGLSLAALALGRRRKPV